MRIEMKTRVLWALAIVGLLLFGSATALADGGEAGETASEAESEQEEESERSEDVIDHAPFETLLKKYVDGKGMVAYGRLHRSEADREVLNRYVAAIGDASVEGHGESARLAFYLNAYNALVLHDVLERWPVETVIEEDGFFDGKKHRVAGRSLTLNELEHDEVIRKEFEEPRIHFVLVCAAVDCPRLRTTALTVENLERELAAATREFVPGATRLTSSGVVETSQLFNWFAEDFEKDAGSVAVYLGRNVRDLRLRAALASDDVEITFAEYNWAINQQ